MYNEVKGMATESCSTQNVELNMSMIFQNLVACSKEAQECMYYVANINERVGGSMPIPVQKENNEKPSDMLSSYNEIVRNLQMSIGEIRFQLGKIEKRLFA